MAIMDHLLENEKIDNILDFRNEDFEDVLQDADMPPRRPLGMGHRYLERRLVIIVHIWIRRVNVEVHYNFCATVYAGPQKIRGGKGTKNRETFQAELPADQMLGGYIEQPMLVSVVEVADESEQRRKFSVPSIIRLQSLDFCPRGGVQRSEPSISFLRPFLGVTDYRKLN